MLLVLWTTTHIRLLMMLLTSTSLARSVVDVCRLMVRVRDPDDEVLARAYQHAIDVAKLDGGHCCWMEVKKAHLLTRLYIPHYNLLLRSFTACH